MADGRVAPPKREPKEREASEAVKPAKVLSGKGVSVAPKHTNADVLAFQHPARSVLVGASESGKTFFLVNMIDRPHVVGKLNGKTRHMWANYDAVVWMAPTFSIEQKVLKELKKKMGKQLTFIPVDVGDGIGPDGLNKLNEILDANSKAGIQTAVVNDDIAAATSDKLTLQMIKELAISGRHRNASLISLTQQAFTAKSRTTRLQTNYWVLFRVGASEVTQVARQLFPIQWREVFEAYKIATGRPKPGQYLMIDEKAALSQSPDKRILAFRDSALDNVVLGLAAE